MILANVMALTAAAATAGALAWSNDRVAQIRRIEIPPMEIVGPTGEPLDTEVTEGEPINYLIVGVDDASGLSDGDNVRRRPDTNLRTDTIMILRVDPEEASADVLSFPRDLLVPIAGTDSRARINTALETGGPIRLIQTIGENFGVPVHHYVQIDFAGFRELVDVVEGIPVYFPHPVRSSKGTVELSIPEAGCWVLGPRQALGFSRIRTDFQAQDADGEWHLDGGGDYSRVERQQLFIQLGLRRAIARGARNPATLRSLVDLGVLSVTVDDLEVGDLVDLGGDFRNFDPAELVTHTLPVDEAPRGGPAYLYLREDEAEATLALFRGEDVGVTRSVPSREVVVQVRNGTGAERQAGEVTADLADVGFETLVPGADAAPGSTTVVVHPAGAEGEAHTLARHLVGPARYQVDTTLADGQVVLVTGSDWQGVSAVARAADQVAAPPGAALDPPGEPSNGGAGSTTATAATTPVTNAPAGGDASGALEGTGDVEDPDDPAFFRATSPPPGATCRPTP